MKIITKLSLLMCMVLITACSSTQSLQEYYIDNSENPNFLKLDVPTSVLNLADVDLSESEREAMQSLKKLNILAFKKTNENNVEYNAEKEVVKRILKNDKFNELMKFNFGGGNASVQYLGDDDAIDEVVIYGNSEEKGFALIRVLGDNMKPQHMMQLIKAIQKSNYKGEGLEQLGSFLK
ncbi:DUF4252 domain-containing protein [Aurantibacter crassamenti]|uniref:DUF4252 domain-containing protein n=1 Tax=Aurantibacter crassamenti TaxID=1837375 RepID=UPI00193A9206|nr:DUF4252 domain-containing protein [Aurantibacter crassamenti]MBM1107572.1 DUF4252 domain-containing protein [Aurantibacter crassamenti]